MSSAGIEARYRLAREAYAELGVDVERALERMDGVRLSLHVWQGDDVGGFERAGATLNGGGLAVTGSHGGRARSPEELREDLAFALRLIPGRHKVNLHAIYGEFGGRRVERTEVEIGHFAGWIDWAREHAFGLDFNPTLFSHPLAADNRTLTHPDESVAGYWVEHVRACRRIAEEFGRAFNTPSVHNLWIPDGSKDAPADRLGWRTRLLDRLDRIYGGTKASPDRIDSVESKLFGLGTEAFVAGSHEFYLLYAQTRGLWPCLDMGHFHPTESVADKLSSLLPFFDGLLLHLSRGVRWDSDHVTILNDDLLAAAQEVVRADALGRVALALDYFDAQMNRVGAWVIGARAVLTALLVALLEPRPLLLADEERGDFASRLARSERSKAMPFGAVWDAWCERRGAPAGLDFLDDVQGYWTRVQSGR